MSFAASLAPVAAAFLAAVAAAFLAAVAACPVLAAVIPGRSGDAPR